MLACLQALADSLCHIQHNRIEARQSGKIDGGDDRAGRGSIVSGDCPIRRIGEQLHGDNPVEERQSLFDRPGSIREAISGPKLTEVIDVVLERKIKAATHDEIVAQDGVSVIKSSDQASTSISAI